MIFLFSSLYKSFFAQVYTLLVALSVRCSVPALDSCELSSCIEEQPGLKLILTLILQALGTAYTQYF